jgi:Ca2+-binding EF-hand superfamily protein
MRFRGLDRNGDGVITRSEWRGSARSFDVHDWNGDGVLSGAEVLTGNRQAQQDPAEYEPGDLEFRNWTRAGFQALDHDGNSRITLDEWHYAPADFWRADRNRNNSLELTEFLAEDFDDDRGDRFQFLDTNRDGRIAPAEWHSTRTAFEWLDVDRNGYLTRDEVDGESPGEWDRFDSVDIDNSETVSLREWHWSRASFDRLDTNRDGVLSRLEFGTDGSVVGTPAARRTITVDPTQRWTSTRIVLAPGDIVSFEASGTIQMNEQRSDPASPAGSLTGRTVTAAPLPQVAAGALIASIDGGPAFEIGASTSGYRAANGGVLYLGVNDDHLPDNSGSFRVVVTVTGR